MRIADARLFQVGNNEYVPGPVSLDQPVGTLPVVDDARWSAALTSHSWIALVFWIVLLVVLQAAMWPLVRQVFRRFPDRGWAFGRLVTMLTAGYLVWLGARVELISFRAVWCGTAVIAVAAGSFLTGRWLRSGSPDNEREPWFRNGYIVAAEGVFWGVFALFLLYRFINPDSYHIVSGGEKPMEFAHINAILRSAHFPPYDPWYSDGTLNYYYYGMYLMAFLMKLTGIPSEIAFNLAQPTVIAMLATGAFGLSMALAKSLTARRLYTFVGGVAGLVLVSFAGNLVAAARFLSGLTGSMVSSRDYGYWFWGPTRIVAYTINEFPYFTATYADLHAHVVALPMTVLVVALCFALVGSPREMLLTVARPQADLRSTVRVTLTLALAALTLGSLYSTNAWDVPTYAALTVVSLLLATRGLRGLPIRMAVTLGLTLLVGVVAFLVALPFASNYISFYGEIGTGETVSAPVEVLGHFGLFFVIVPLGLLYLNSRNWRGAPWFAQPWLYLAAVSAILLYRLWAVDESELTIEFADGLLVLVVTAWLALSVIAGGGNRKMDFGLPGWAGPVLAILVWVGVIVALVVDKIALGLFLAIGGIAVVTFITRTGIGERFIAVLLAGAMLIGAGMEVVYLVDGLDGAVWYRMNTVFKFYNQVWILAAIGSGTLIAMMARAAFADAPQRETATEPPKDVELSPNAATAGTGYPVFMDEAPANDTEPDPGPPLLPEYGHRGLMAQTWAQFGLIVTCLVVMASLAYPALATKVRLDQHFIQDGASPTLNALDWMDYGLVPEYGTGGVLFSYDEDRRVIEWFNDEVPGSPVIAEASIDQYWCAGSRIAIHTGLPVVVGWPWHEVQQRDWTDIHERQETLRTLYTSTDIAQKEAILERYRVEYVIVGDLERNYPTNNCHSTDNAAGVEAFQSMVGTSLEVAFQAGDTVVYQVIR
jgi:YYY domain-containing protein